MKPGEVYIIRADGTNLCKIGSTRRPKARMRALLKQSPYPLAFVVVAEVSDYSSVEKRMHFEFRKLRTNGEWFFLDSYMLAIAKATLLEMGREVEVDHEPVRINPPPDPPQTRERPKLPKRVARDRARDINIDVWMTTEMLNWIDGYCERYSSRRGFVVALLLCKMRENEILPLAPDAR